MRSPCVSHPITEPQIDDNYEFLCRLWSPVVGAEEGGAVARGFQRVKGLENTRSRMFAPLVGIWTSWSRYRKLVSSISEFAWVEQVPVECQSISGKLKSPSIIMSQRGVGNSPMNKRILLTISSNASLVELGGL